MTGKHTPAPWEVSEVKSDGTLVYRQIRKAGVNVYRSSIASTGKDEEAEANAALIAKAPELYQLVLDLWWFIENVNEDTEDKNDRFFKLRERFRKTMQDF